MATSAEARASSTARSRERYGLELRFPQEHVVGREARRTDDRNGFLHDIGISRDPLESLHPAHGDARDRV